MNLRALVLLGWNKPTQPGPPPVVNLYTGQDGTEMVKAHSEAQKTGKYLAFRKIINPVGIPLNVVVDPPPGKMNVPRPEPTDPDEHPVGVRRKRAKAAAEKAAAELQMPEEPPIS